MIMKAAWRAGPRALSADRLVEKMEGRLSRKVSMTALLSCRLTSRSSGWGTKGSSISETTCAEANVILIVVANIMLKNVDCGLGCAIISLKLLSLASYFWLDTAVRVSLHRISEVSERSYKCLP